MSRQIEIDFGVVAPPARVYWRVQVRLGESAWQYVLSEPGASECAAAWEARGAVVEKKIADVVNSLDGDRALA